VKQKQTLQMCTLEVGRGASKVSEFSDADGNVVRIYTCSSPMGFRAARLSASLGMIMVDRVERHKKRVLCLDLYTK